MSFRSKILGALVYIKNAAVNLFRWVLIAEVITLVTVFAYPYVPDIISYVTGRESTGEDVTDETNISTVSFIETVYELTWRGELFLLSIPLVAGLILELFERKTRGLISAAGIVWLIVILIIYARTYPEVLKEEKQLALVKLTAYFPLISLNISAGIVAALPDDTSYRKQKRRRKR